MIAPEAVAEIRRLLIENRLSQREIARQTGVCRGSVGAIASGRRPDYESRLEPADEEPSGPPVRCPVCGGKVYMPCVFCRVRAEMKTGRRLPVASRRDGDLESTDLCLRPEHRARYDEVREARLRLQVIGLRS
jgi:hypothetical protein